MKRFTHTLITTVVALSMFVSTVVPAQADTAAMQQQLSMIQRTLQSLQQLTMGSVLGASADSVSGLALRYDMDAVPGGTTVGDPTVVAGVEGSGAVNFDGAGDGVNLGSPSELNITGAISLSAWVKLTGGQNSGWGRVISRTNGATAEDWGMVISTSDVLDCRVNGSSPSGHQLSRDVWHHVVCTYDGNTVRAYVDGVEVDSHSRSGSLPTDNPVAIGYNATGGDTRHFTGDIDDVRVYNRALTANDVRAIRAGVTGDEVDPVDPTPSDADNDGVEDILDNCPNVANSNQTDSDNDGEGDVCDSTPNGSLPPSETPLGDPYGHVTPGDVGVKIGTGVIGATPTQVYSGGNRITSPRTIENQIINTCLSIESDDVVIRNSIINCGGLYPVKLVGGAQNFVFEYNELRCTSQSKMFYFQSGGPNAKIRYNHGIGCDDFFFMDGNLDGVEIAYNYIHTTTAGPSSHSDGFQIGQNSRTYGDMRVFGNYFDPDNDDAGETALIFSTRYSEIDLTLENNRIIPWGAYTIRCGGTAPSCTLRNNVFSTTEEAEGSPIVLGSATAACNRYQDGSFPSSDIFGSNSTNNCPAFGSGSVPDPDDPAPTDTDGDGVADTTDNCPAVSNANQTDTDGDGEGDACDATPNGDPTPDPVSDFAAGDRVQTTDNLNVRDPYGTSGSVVGVQESGSPGTVLNIDPQEANGYVWIAVDFDSGVDGWVADAFLTSYSDPAPTDTDGDGVADTTDNCPAVSNANQTDTDGDGEGDACDATPNGDPVSEGEGGISDSPAYTGWPDETTTGSRVSESSLDVINGDYTINEDGFVFANKLVNGTLTIEADNVTVRDTIVRGGCINVGASGSTWSRGYVNTVIEFTEVDGQNSGCLGVNNVGRSGGEQTVIRYSNIHNAFDLLRTNRYGLTVTDSYLHTWANTDTGNHADAIQVIDTPLVDGSTIEFHRNYIVSPLDHPTQAVGSLGINSLREGWVMENNRLEGAGYFVYIHGSDFIFNNNVMGPHQWGPSRTYNNAVPAEFNNNTDYEGYLYEYEVPATSGGVSFIKTSTQVDIPVPGEPSNPDPTGDTTVSNASELADAIASASAGDVIELETGDYGALVIDNEDNTSDITIRAATGATPRFTTIDVNGSEHWVLDGLTVRPSSNTTAVEIDGGANITLQNSHISFADSAAGWSATNWVSNTAHGITIGGSNHQLIDNTIEYVDMGILGSMQNGLVHGNTIRNFRGDGIQFSGNTNASGVTIEDNYIANNYDVDGNHDDGIQFYTRSSAGTVGAGTISDVTIRGNTIIQNESASQPLRGPLQGIGNFDGMFEDWVIEDNVIMVDQWHGISMYGAARVLITNNTVIDPVSGGSEPWIAIFDHKDGTVPSGSTIENNIATRYSGTSVGVTSANNVTIDFSEYDQYFVDWQNFDFTLRDDAPVSGVGANATGPIDVPDTTPNDPFDNGDRVEATSNVNVRTTGQISSATLIGTNPQGSIGTVVAGPTYSNDSYGEITWYEIDFDSGFDGWVGADNLAAYTDPAPTDTDGDGVADADDNCPAVSNTDQADADNDGIGDECDATPNGDVTAPVIGGVSVDNITETGAVITWTTDELTTREVKYGESSSYGKSTGESSSVATSHTAILSGLEADTTYHFQVVSRDAAGNSAASQDDTFTTLAAPDTANPLVSLDEPADGATVSGVITIAAVASDTTGVGQLVSGIASVAFSVDGQTIATDTSAPFTTGLDTTTLSDGSHTITARALDNAGNSATDGVTVTTDNTVEPPADTTDPTITFVSEEATNNDPITHVIVYETDEPTTATLSFGINRNNLNQSVDSAALSTSHTFIIEGLSNKENYYYELAATDAAGNTSSSDTNSFRTIGKPQKIDNLTARSGSIILEWDLPNDENIDEVIVIRKVGGAPGRSSDNPLVTLEADATTYTDESAEDDRRYTYTVFTVSDGEFSDPVSVTFAKETTKPDLTDEAEAEAATEERRRSRGGSSGGSSSGNDTRSNEADADEADAPSTPAANNRVRTTDNLKVRVTPNGALIDIVSANAGGERLNEVPVTRAGYTWIKVRFDNGIEGYVAQNFVRNEVATTSGGGLSATERTAILTQIMQLLQLIQQLQTQLEAMRQGM